MDKEYMRKYQQEHKPGVRNKYNPYKPLKECPFCHSKNLKLEDAIYYSGYYLVKCFDCFAISEKAESQEKAVDNWNDEIFTDTTKLLNKECDYHSDGVFRLTETIFEEASAAYENALRMVKRDPSHKKDYQFKLLERFFTESPLMKGVPVDGNDVISRIQRRVEDGNKDSVKKYKSIL